MKTTLPLNSAQIRARLVSALTQYDARQAKRRDYNRNALSIYFARLDDLMADIEAGSEVRQAICAAFLGRTADACLRALGLPVTTRTDEPASLFYVPASKL